MNSFQTIVTGILICIIVFFIAWPYYSLTNLSDLNGIKEELSKIREELRKINR